VCPEALCASAISSSSISILVRIYGRLRFSCVKKSYTVHIHIDKSQAQVVERPQLAGKRASDPVSITSLARDSSTPPPRCITPDVRKLRASFAVALLGFRSQGGAVDTSLPLEMKDRSA
jgi:hypothetical protein